MNNSILNVVATAVADLTGEGFSSARDRLADRRTWTGLVASASGDQALLEALIFGGLAVFPAQTHPFGVMEAFQAEAALLHLKLESAGAVEALLDLLPYADRRGTRRGVPGLQTLAAGNQLEVTASFGEKFGIRWDSKDPKVRIHAPGSTPLSVVLQDHYDRLVRERCVPHWVPGEQPKPFLRRPPLARDTISQHRASAGMASALLRRPRMWTALAGHQRLAVSSTFAEHGLDWMIARTVARGTALHDKRLIELLQDNITGPDMELLDHVCEEACCTVRLIGTGRYLHGWKGVLTLRTEHGSSPKGRPARTLTALGEPQTSGRPREHIDSVQQSSRGRCIAMASASVAVRLSAAWAAQGHVAAVLTIKDRERDMTWSRDWPTEEVPRPTGTTLRWNRLRLTPDRGQVWTGSLTLGSGKLFEASDGEEDIAAALDAARDRYSRILVLDQRPYARGSSALLGAVDAVALVIEASKYPRQTTTPAWRRALDGECAIDLAPQESAALWREQHLGVRDLSRQCLAGLVLLHDDAEDVQADTFTEQVEMHLRRYGTPVLGWLSKGSNDLRLPRDGADRTVLDPMNEEDRSREVVAASAIGGQLW